MKKRLGFVSNSSSSSFIIIFDEEPKNTGDIKRMLFGDKTIISYYDNNITTNLASDIIFKDIEKATKQKLEADFDSIIYSMEYFKPEAWLIDGDDKEVIEYNKLENEQWSKWEEWRAMSPIERERKLNRKEVLLTSIMKRMFENFDAETKGKFVYQVEFSDNDGDIYCTLEHGDVFDKVKHIRINNH